MTRRILVATGNRADYAPLSPLLHQLHARSDVDAQLLVTGAHLAGPDPTRTHIERDGFATHAEVEILLDSDTPVGVAKSLALCVMGVAEALARLRPDVAVVLGDRYEALGVAQAAMLADVPLAHIGGGESTDGVADEAIRHSITKMAHLHFVAAPAFRRRVLQLGERPSRVWTVGALGLDNLARLPLLDRDALAEELGVDLRPPLILLTYHPVARGPLAPADACAEVLGALDAFPQATVLATRPNVDAGAGAVVAALEASARKNPDRFHLFSTLGQRRYLSALATADVVVGNSSSGLIEAPAVQVPTVDVGIRQRGRLRAPSVLHRPEQADTIAEAIATALSPKFRAQIRGVHSPYGHGDAAPQIADVLATAELDGLLTKSFYDLTIPIET